MSLSIFLVIILLIIVAVAYYHFTQGLFSATVSAILCIFSAVLAVGWHEKAVVLILGGQMADSANSIMLMCLFGLFYLLLRTLFDRVVPGNVNFPSLMSKIGAVVMGLVAGFFAAGVCAMAAQALPLPADLMGYARYEVTEKEGRPPKEVEKSKDAVNKAFDYLADGKPFHERTPDMVTKLIVPVDDVLVNTVTRLSGSGALATSTPLEQYHPEWLNELFGQRLGIEAAGKRVMMNTGKQTDLVALPDGATKNDAGVYDFGTDKKDRIRRTNADYDSLHQGRGDYFPPQADDGTPLQKPNIMNVVLRVYFGDKAKDPRFGVIQLSPAAVRLVAKRTNPDTQKMEWANYYPIGTLEGIEQPTTRRAGTPEPDKFVFYSQRQDDFMVIDDSSGAAGAAGDKGVDFVFAVERNGFAEGDGKAAPAKVIDGAFIEVKRLARVDLSGTPIKKREELKPKPNVFVTRKKWIKDNEPRDPMPLVAEKLVRGGRWKGNSENNAYLQFSMPGKDGKGTISVTNLETGASRPGATYTPIVALGNKLVLDIPNLKLKPNDPQAPPLKRTIISWDNENLMTVMGEDNNTYMFTAPEKGSSPAPPPPPPVAVTPATPPAVTPSTPATPTPTPATSTPTPTPPPAAAGPAFAVADVQERPKNPNFVANVGVPAGSTGDVDLGPVGKVTLVQEDDGTGGKRLALSALTVNPTAIDKLDPGTGGSAKRLAVPAGHEAIQVVITPGAGGTGWEWAKAIDGVTAVDSTGKPHDVRGAFAHLPGDTVLARYASEQKLSAADLTPAPARPDRVELVFVVPTGTTIKEVRNGADVVKAFNPPIPVPE